MKPEQGKVVVVSSIPDCYFCWEQSKKHVPGPYDFATRLGPWANGCEYHWRLLRAAPDLGVGAGQLWITEDQVER
jgi:hypothetical protein